LGYIFVTDIIGLPSITLT